MTRPLRPLMACAASLLALLAAAGCSPTPPVAVTAPTTASSGMADNGAASAPSVAASANVADIDVTEHVKTALRQNEALKGFDITVVTINGDVRLNGVLDSQAQIDEALRIARAADGAHAIHDELTVRK